MLRVVGLGRVELPTSPLSGVRSSHLSYRPGPPGSLRITARSFEDKLNVRPSYAESDYRAIYGKREDPRNYLAPDRQAGERGTWQPRTPKGVRAMTFSLRKEVIQPQVLLRLPCYDFTPIMSYTLDGYSPEGLAHRLLVQPTFVM